MTCKPVVKWVGGKTKLLPELIARAPKLAPGETYFEPFAGGAALFFALTPERAVLGDMNRDLMMLYATLRSAKNCERVIGELEVHRRNHNETYYYGMRDRWNARGANEKLADCAALFLYLNKTCFNGLWRVNRDGQFNVPIGQYKNPPNFDAENLREAGRALANATLCALDYRSTVEDACAGDFAYFDPPYHPVSETANFASYTASGFGSDQQVELHDFARELATRGVRVMLSNSDCDFTRELYGDASVFRVDRVECGRSINSNGAKRGRVGELIITGGY